MKGESKMNKYIKSNVGYIVFDDGGTCPIAYKACEEWFATYDEAIDYALSVVKENIESLKNRKDYNKVMIYKGEESLLSFPHKIPCGTVIFKWTNYN